MGKNDFLKRLAEGNMTELFLANKLKAAGVDVEKPEYPTNMPTKWYTKNQIDLVANNKILEVKGRRVVFTNVQDYPYPTLFIESVHGFDSKAISPAFYVNVSNSTGCIIALDVVKTRADWTVETVTDRFRDQTYDMYVCGKDLWMDEGAFIKELGVHSAES